MSNPKRVTEAEVNEALRALLAGPDAAFEESWGRMREALRSALAGSEQDAGVGAEVAVATTGPDEGALAVEVLPKGSTVYEVFPVREVFTDAPPARGRLAVALDVATGDLGLFAPRSWRADWTSARLRSGRQTFAFAEGPGAPMGPADEGRPAAALTARVDEATKSRLLGLAKKTSGR